MRKRSRVRGLKVRRVEKYLLIPGFYLDRVVCAVQVAPGEGALLEVAQWGRLLLYSTQRGGVHALVTSEPREILKSQGNTFTKP